MSNTNFNLKFPMLRLGRYATPWDLTAWLYREGAAQDRKLIAQSPDGSLLGEFLSERVSLIVALHEEVTAGLIAGGSHATSQHQLNSLRCFIRWLDENARVGKMESAEQDFLDWTEMLLQQNQSIRRVKDISLYGQVSTVGGLLERALCLQSSLLQKSRVRKPRYRQACGIGPSQKESITDTFRFGRFLIDLCDALDVRNIRGPLPLVITLSDGGTLEEWAGMVHPAKVKALKSVDARGHKLAVENRALWSADSSTQRRRPLINLRIQAELLIFISQTGMNLSQAYQLKTGKFSFSTHFQGYQVRRVYKDRRKGEVEFEIFSAYRVIFDRYLKWRNEFFPDELDTRLFPLESQQGRSANIAPEFHSIEKRCEMLGIDYVGPRKLRKSRQNWLLLRTDDIELTAQMGQHTANTLLRHYARPNHHRAAVEISRFHVRTEGEISSPGPGNCASLMPALQRQSPNQAPEPDCVNPAGCLFCMNHRDLDSLDYIWSLASYRYLKTLELSRSSVVPGQAKISVPAVVVERVTSILKDFTEIHDRFQWVDEANARVWEANFHPQWDGFIRLVEQDEEQR